MNPSRRAVLCSLLLLPVAATADPKADAVQKFKEQVITEGKTPFQKKMKEKIDELKGQPDADVPDPEFDAVEVDERTDDTWTNKDGSQGRGHRMRIKAVTRMKFKGPHQAGYKGGKWPDLVVKKQNGGNEGPGEPCNDFLETGKCGKGDYAPDPVETVSYDDVYRAKAQERIGEPCIVEEPDGDGGFTTRPGEPLWKGTCLDADGKPDHSRGKFEFAKEERTVTITETVDLKFPALPEEGAPATLRALAVEPRQAGPNDVLLGFNYGGPHIDYTIGDSAEICFFGCFTIYDFRAGFALDWNIGLRLPATATLNGFTNMIAGQTYGFTSFVNPQGNCPEGSSSCALPEVVWDEGKFAAVGVEPDGGNEFVFVLDFFAGAKVIIAETNVCPWCQYVEIAQDQSTRFVTPFGEGASFPIPAIPIPLKDFDFGVVTLGLGLSVQPLIGSGNISATLQGPGVPGTPVAHLAPGAATSTSVKACIQGSHTATYDLRDFRYQFDRFGLGLGVTLDLAIFGFGAWNPTIPIMNLDLSSIFGGLGLSLGKYKQCNWWFNCTPRGPSNVVSVPADLVDVDAPTSTISLPPTDGKRGWYVSDVGVGLAAADNPPSCGIGVAGTEYSLDGGGSWQAFTPFNLSNGVTTVSYRSTDADGNTEAVKARVVQIDEVDPVFDTILTGPTTLPNVHNWYNHDVTVAFHASDTPSGLYDLTDDVTLTAEGAGQSVVGTAEDRAGRVATITVGGNPATSPGINIDKTPPTIAISSPSPTATYRIRPGAVLDVAWTQADDLSRVDFVHEKVLLDGLGAESWGGSWTGIPMPLISGGNHVVEVFETDFADNEGMSRVEFLVDVDIDGLLAATAYHCASGGIKTPGICNSLTAKATEAKRYMAAGMWTNARGVLGAYLNEVDAQMAKGVLAPIPHAVLRMDATYVLTNYVLVQIPGT